MDYNVGVDVGARDDVGGDHVRMGLLDWNMASHEVLLMANVALGEMAWLLVELLFWCRVVSLL